MTVVVLIGNSDNKLTQQQYSSFCRQMHDLIIGHAAGLHFSGGSAWADKYQNACWVSDIEDSQLVELEAGITSLREKFRQDSVAVIVGSTQFV